MRKFINEFLFKITGHQLVNKKSRDKFNLFNTFDFILKKLIDINKKEKIIIFDVGGNKGEFVEFFLKLLKKNNIKNYKIFYFEPITSLFNQVKEKNYRNTIEYNFALGDKNETKLFYEIKDSNEKENNDGPFRGKSSFLKINKSNKSEKLKMSKNHKKIYTIDSFCKKNKIKKIHVLKIDTQAYNINVLKGAKKYLNNNMVDAIYTELTIGRRYEKNETFFALEEKLKKNYELFGIDVGTMQVQLVSRILNRNLNLDVLYLKKNIIDKILR